MEWRLEMDGKLLLWLKETFSHPVLDEIMIFISSLGNKGMIWIAIGVLFLLFGFRNKKWRSRGFLVLFSLAANFLACNVILKPLIDRTRPYYVLDYTPLIPPVGDPSFPSGHTSASFAAATASSLDSMAIKSTPRYCLTASAMVSLAQPGARLTWWPIHSSS